MSREDNVRAVLAELLYRETKKQITTNAYNTLIISAAGVVPFFRAERPRCGQA
jgi:hypothetical protein